MNILGTCPSVYIEFSYANVRWLLYPLAYTVCCFNPQVHTRICQAWYRHLGCDCGKWALCWSDNKLSIPSLGVHRWTSERLHCTRPWANVGEAWAWECEDHDFGWPEGVFACLGGNGKIACCLVCATHTVDCVFGRIKKCTSRILYARYHLFMCNDQSLRVCYNAYSLNLTK